MGSLDYRQVALKRLSDVDWRAIVALMNDPAVRRHMPLSLDAFGRAECNAFVAAKERLWEEHGYGPWAFVLGGEFIGWGGLQPEGDDVDLGLVLHPRHWGAGMILQKRIVDYAFDELGVPSVIALLPFSRTRTAALGRLGFVEDGDVAIGESRFRRFRLLRDSRRPSREA